MTTARYGGRLSALRTGRLYPHLLIFTTGWVDPRAMVWSEGNMSLKNPMTTPGNDPGTVRLVAQRLNHYATPGPVILLVAYKNSEGENSQNTWPLKNKVWMTHRMIYMSWRWMNEWMINKSGSMSSLYQHSAQIIFLHSNWEDDLLGDLVESVVSLNIQYHYTDLKFYCKGCAL